MDDLNVIDRFTATFLAFIDSGFGLLGPDVEFLIRALVVIDITLAGLWWAFADGADVIAQLVRKVLYVGAFAFLLANFGVLAQAVFDSFVALGIQASGSGIRAADLLRPGFVAATGVGAAHPILEEVGTLVGFPGLLVHAVEVALLVLAWLVVVASFLVLAVQMFVTLVDFKLAALAGFVLVPFALWGKTAFLAERVLGHVAATGVKVMVLAVVVGIGSTLFADVALALRGEDVTVERVIPLVLAALSLLAVGIHGPAVASGLVAGGPRLDAGHAAAAAGAAGRAAASAGGVAAAGGRRLARGPDAAARAAAGIPRAGAVPPRRDAPGGGGGSA